MHPFSTLWNIRKPYGFSLQDWYRVGFYNEAFLFYQKIENCLKAVVLMLLHNRI